ncbi:MAG: hypothetical protein E7E36_07890 [Veillonella sp.]|nr:hypothetical protein [Veillonella sp.]
MARFQVKFRYKSTGTTNRGGITSTTVTAASSYDARNQVISSHSHGNGITIVSVVRKD